MRYWRHYPKFLQTILLMLLIFTLASFSFVVASFGVTQIFGVSIERIPSLANNNIIHAAQFVQAVTSLFTFLLSALLFAYLTHPLPGNYLGLRKVSSISLLFVSIMLMFTAIPLINELGAWIQEWDLGKAAKQTYEEQQRMTHTMMSGKSVAHLVLYLLLFAALPALGEEMLFRGVVMRLAYGNTKNIHYAVVFSAAIFATAHGSAYNFLPITLAGVLLGYLYYLSSSLWVNIIAHFLNNAFAVVLLFLGNRGIVPKELGSDTTHLPWSIVFFALVAFLLLFLLVRKWAQPLPQDWNNDFKE